MDKILVAESESNERHLAILAAETKDGVIEFAEGFDDAARTELRKAAKAGDVLKVRARFLAYVSRTNLNYWRIPEEQLETFSRSATTPFNRPFQKDHDLRQDSRGGTIVDSEVIAIEDGGRTYKAVAQTVDLVKDWAIEGVLDGTIDRVSVGVQIRDDTKVICSECGQDLLAEGMCGHYRGTPSKKFAGTKIEHVLQNPYFKELSAVVSPAELGAGLLDILTVDETQANMEDAQMMNYAALEARFPKSIAAKTAAESIVAAGTANMATGSELSVGAGEITEINAMFEETENEIRFRILPPALFRDGSFRRKNLPTAGVAIVIGKLKNPPKGEEGSMVTQAYRFDKGNGWTMAKAKTWIDKNVKQTAKEASMKELKEKIAEATAEELVEAHEGLTEMVGGLKAGLTEKDEMIALLKGNIEKIEDEKKKTDLLVAEMEDKRAEEIKINRRLLASSIVTLKVASGTVEPGAYDTEVEALVSKETAELEATLATTKTSVDIAKIYGKASAASGDGGSQKKSVDVMVDAVTSALMGDEVKK